MTEAEFDQLTGQVFATPQGTRWLAEAAERSEIAHELWMQVLARLARMRALWRQGAEAANDS